MSKDFLDICKSSSQSVFFYIYWDGFNFVWLTVMTMVIQLLFQIEKKDISVVSLMPQDSTKTDWPGK